jgi:hypothetical protein
MGEGDDVTGIGMEGGRVKEGKSHVLSGEIRCAESIGEIRQVDISL